MRPFARSCMHDLAGRTCAATSTKKTRGNAAQGGRPVLYRDAPLLGCQPASRATPSPRPLQCMRLSMTYVAEGSRCA